MRPAARDQPTDPIEAIGAGGLGQPGQGAGLLVQPPGAHQHHAPAQQGVEVARGQQRLQRLEAHHLLLASMSTSRRPLTSVPDCLSSRHTAWRFSGVPHLPSSRAKV